MDDSMLDGLDPNDLLDAECGRVERHLTTLGADTWQQPSRCEGWTTRDMMSHLLGVEIYNRACLDDAIGKLFEEAGRHGADDVESFNDWLVRVHSARPTADVIAEWRDLNARFRAEMRERGDTGTVATSVGPYPSRWQAFHLASEYATHADDIAVPVPDREQRARAAWRARFAQFALIEMGKDVVIEHTGDSYRVRSGEDEAVLDEHDFVEASQARLPVAHPLGPALREALRSV
jgi:uncharacterized protein (TIGR03083 family)